MTAADKRYHTVVVTGGAGGIGWELARRLAPEAEVVVLVGRNIERLEAGARRLEEAVDGCAVHVIAQDLGEPGAAAALAAKVRARGLKVDALVNNAGFGYDAPFVGSDAARQRSLVMTNDVALMELCHEFAPGMVERSHGAILNVASVAGFLPGPYMATYYASKAFVQSFTQALHVELSGTGVHVTALCPGPVRTEFWDRADAGNTVLAHATVPVPLVARAACLALRANKAVCAPGIIAKLIIFCSRLLPRTLYGRIAALTQTPFS